MNRSLQILLLSISINISIISQWQNDIRLTYDTNTSATSNANCIVANGNFIFINWFDSRNGNSEIYFKRSTNRGISWEPDLRLTFNSYHSSQPSISTFNSYINIIWQDYVSNSPDNYDISLIQSSNYGVTWSAEVRLINNIYNARHPVIATYDSNLFVVWEDFRDRIYPSSTEIYFKRSTDKGLTWSRDIRLTNAGSLKLYPSISVANQIIHIVWADNRESPGGIFYKKSTDNGNTWTQDLKLTNGAYTPNVPKIVFSGSFIHVIWQDYRNGLPYADIYYKQSTNTGVSWGNDIRLTWGQYSRQSPSLSYFDSNIHVYWTDYRAGIYGIYNLNSQDNGNSWSNETCLVSHSQAIQSNSSVSIDSILHLIWTDSKDGNPEIYYKRNPTGNVLGLETINSNIPSEFMLEQNFPNPFNPVTKIKFQIPKSGYVSLEIYDALGRNVTTLVNENLNPGIYEAEWNAVNQPSGIYFYKLVTSEFSEVKKMVLVK